MVARLTEVAVMLIVVSAKVQVVVPQKRWVAYSISFVYSAIWILVIYYYPTPIIYFLIARFCSKEVFNFMLIVASVYLMLADSIFTTYKGVYDINNFIGPVSISRLLFSAKRGRVEIGFKHMV